MAEQKGVAAAAQQGPPKKSDKRKTDSAPTRKKGKYAVYASRGRVSLNKVRHLLFNGSPDEALTRATKAGLTNYLVGLRHAAPAKWRRAKEQSLGAFSEFAGKVERR